MLAAGDPTGEIGAAWAVKEGLRMLLAETEPPTIRWRLADFYDAAVEANIPRPPCSPTPPRPGGRPSSSR